MDYNIYIHDSTGGSQNGSFTVPWGSLQKEQSPTTSWQSPEEQDMNFNLKNGSVKSFIDMGVGALGKAIPQVAAAFAVIKLGELVVKGIDKVIETGLPFYETATGDYMLGTQYHNMKNFLNSLTHPMSTALNALRNYQAITVNNQRKSYNRELLGDSLINTYTNRGV